MFLSLWYGAHVVRLLFQELVLAEQPVPEDLVQKVQPVQELVQVPLEQALVSELALLPVPESELSVPPELVLQVVLMALAVLVCSQGKPVSSARTLYAGVGLHLLCILTRIG